MVNVPYCFYKKKNDFNSKQFHEKFFLMQDLSSLIIIVHSMLFRRLFLMIP